MTNIPPLLVVLLAFIGGALVQGGTLPYGKNVPRFPMVCCGVTIVALAVTLAYS